MPFRFRRSQHVTWGLLGMAGAFAAFTAVPQVHAQTLTEFQQGLADREAFESWFAGLSGEYRSGAYFWAGQRSLRDPTPCASLGGQATEGCNAAKTRLDVSDARRKLVPAYRQGWNSYAAAEPPPAPAPQAAPPPPTAPTAQAAPPPAPTPQAAEPLPAPTPQAMMPSGDRTTTGAQAASCHDTIRGIRVGMNGMTEQQQLQYLKDDVWSFQNDGRALFDWSGCSPVELAAEFAGLADHAAILAEVAGNTAVPRYDIDAWCQTRAANSVNHCMNIQQGHYDYDKLVWQSISDYARLACTQASRKTEFSQNYASLRECLSQWGYNEGQWRQYGPSHRFHY